MKSFTSIAALVATLATSALAATNTTLPFAACMLPCDTAALAKVGCAATDIPCHCEKAPETFTYLTSCVFFNSTCGEAAYSDLLAFGKFAADSCTAINMTATNITDYLPKVQCWGNTCLNGTSPSSSSNKSNVSTTASPSASVSVFTGAAAGQAGVEKAMWAGLVGVAGLAFAL